MAPAQAPDPGIAPYFFLSYAHTPKVDQGDPDPDRWVFRLYRDLCEDIMNLSDVPPDRAGFMDRNMHPGTVWSHRLAEALATCYVFVPLYSPRYFRSEQCGREWLAFARRMADHAARSGTVSQVIVPALWVGVEPSSIPGVANRIQFDHKALGVRYSQEGFYPIMKLGRYQAEYRQAVLRLAQRIVEIAERTRIGAVPPCDYSSLHSAFDLEDDHSENGRRVEITIAAPYQQSLPAGRNEFYYGATTRDWNPFHPESAQPLGDYAAKLTECIGFRPVVSTLAEQPGHPAANDQPAAPGLLLVDIWETASEAGQARLRQFDERSDSAISPLVPLNSSDSQTVGAKEQLRNTLNSCLPGMLGRVRPKYQMAGNGIPTLGAFGDIFHEMVYEASRKYLRNAPVYPPGPPDGQAVERPRLMGPYFEDPGDGA